MSAHEHTLEMEEHRRQIFEQGASASELLLNNFSMLPEEARAAAKLAVGTSIAQIFVANEGDIATFFQGMWHNLDDPRVLSAAKLPVEGVTA